MVHIRNRGLRAALLSAALLSMATTASAQTDGPAGQPERREGTLARTLGLRGAHVSMGGGSVPYLDREERGNTFETRIGLTFRRLPAWTFALVGTALMDPARTGYEVPGSDGFRPLLGVNTGGLEVQHRFGGARTLHPIAFGGFGRINSAYQYVETQRGGDNVFHREGEQSSGYVQLGVGGEANIARWLRMSLVVGYRGAGELNVPAARAANSGRTTALLFSAGRF
jgi:hypothetical protein